MKTGHASLWWARQFMTQLFTSRPSIAALRKVYSIIPIGAEIRIDGTGLCGDPCGAGWILGWCFSPWRRIAALGELSTTSRSGSSHFVAVRDINLDVVGGELVALLGPSGCGKSTLLRIVSGFIRQSQGRVLFDGEPVDHLIDALRKDHSITSSGG